MDKSNLPVPSQTWGCFLTGLIFCGIGCMSEGGLHAGTFDRLLLVTGSLLMFVAYCAAFARDAQTGTHAREGSEPAGHLVGMTPGQLGDR